MLTTEEQAGSFVRHPAMSTNIEFEQQLDYLCQWIEVWDNQQRCDLMELLLPWCDHDQISFLWTVVEPTLHRDFMYSSLNAFPRSSFSPVSTPLCSEVHKKLGKPRYRAWKLHRIESAILHDEDEVRAWTSASVLPIVKDLPISMALSRTRSPHAEKCESKGSWKCKTTYFGIKLPGIAAPTRKHPARTSASMGCKSAPPSCTTKTSSHYAVRRHMQNEYKKAVLDDCEDGKDRGSWKRLYKSKSCPNITRSACKGQYTYRNHIRNRSYQSDVQPSLINNLPENARCLVHWFEEQWNGWQRNQFLQMFLKVLEPTQLYCLSGLLAVRQYRDFIAMLPEHLAVKILSFLTPKMLLIASQVSKLWRRIASKDELWQAKCMETYVGVPLRTPTIWKEIFKDNVNLKRNWANGRCRVIDISGHTHNVLSVCAHKNRIASGSLDRTIKIWDANTGALVQTLQGHSRGIWSLRFLSNSVLISGSYDKSIRLWSLRTNSCVRILISHEAPVWAIERKGDLLLSGSGDKTEDERTFFDPDPSRHFVICEFVRPSARVVAVFAKVWNIRQCKLLKTFFGHTGCIFCVDLDDDCRRAFTGSGDRTVRVWDIKTGICLALFNIGQLSGTAVTAVSYDQGHLSVGSGRLVSFWSLTSGTCLNVFKGHKDRIESVQLRFHMVNGRKEGGLIVSAGRDGLIKYWDIEVHSCIQTLRGHKDNVNCIAFDDTRIISASYDNQIRVWDFNL